MKQTDGCATASIVLGALSVMFWILTAIPAIVLGIVGLIRIRDSNGWKKGKGLAVAGICLAAGFMLVVPAIYVSTVMIYGHQMRELFRAETKRLAGDDAMTEDLTEDAEDIDDSVEGGLSEF